MEAVVRKSHETRRLSVRGQDIYAITAPVIVEAAERLVRGVFASPGCFALGEIFDAAEFLKSLAPDLSMLRLTASGS